MSDCEIQTQNKTLVMNEEQMNYFKQFCAKEDDKKQRAQKKRLTEKGNPDKRSETSK